VHKDSSLEAVDLVSSIHLLLSERDDQILNESDLRSGLTSIFDNSQVFVRTASYREAAFVRPTLVARHPSSYLVYACAQL
jgi:hypothetical protein